MSVRVMSWVWEHSRAEGTDRLVLLAIADSAGDDGGNAWPSIALLASKAKVSPRTVQRSIRALTLLGEVSVKANAGKYGVNVYRIKMRQSVTPDKLTPPPDSHPSQSDGATPEAGGVTTGAPRGDIPVTRTIQEPSSTIQRTSSSELRPDVERICDRLADRIVANGCKRPNITERWRKSARLLIDVDKRTEEQINRAIDWCQADEFWRANIMSMPKLRDKYDQLRLAARRHTDTKTSTTDARVNDGLALAAQLRAAERKEISA